jgi:hypothetical protein
MIVQAFLDTFPLAGAPAVAPADASKLHNPFCYVITKRMQVEQIPQISRPSERRVFAPLADRVGATASLLCAVHCAALPFVLALLPALGLGFLADHGFEHGFIACASVFAVVTLIYGYRRHRVRRAFIFLLPGLALLWAGGFMFDASDTLVLHATLVALGGTCVALAHLTNLRLVHGLEREACCDQRHDHAIV